MDAINAGFERCFPELGINTYADMSSMDILYNISSKIAPFINAMMSGGEYEEFGDGAVFDVYQLLPEDYIKSIDRSICDIYYMLTADVTPEERYEIQKSTILQRTIHIISRMTKCEKAAYIKSSRVN